jgi:predicted phage tail protein
MKTERRDTPRIPIALDTIVSYNDQNYHHSTTRDISLDGAFVESKAAALAKKGTMELAIKLPVEGAPKYHRFHAQIVRVTKGGAGILFDRVETDSYTALLDLVFSRQGRGLW